MSKHTPAPWKIGGTMQVSHSFDQDTEITEITTLGGEFVACVNLPSDKHAENARLIAAAPDLLNMLQRMVDETSGGNAPCLLTLEQARNALAKAKGE